ncbi:helix-turn-helix transcriptional regulator [Pseudorhodobacter sp. E13]|uniref:helix-turn-helix transcriptional regulator n=1 Tax=Pseudorhodobacter sp. E13 TaxID=2487931 RepID=UPI000F8D53CE|nr:LuxR C-terminal-related transcriptional regulator [Pseudorhodobacter sp. E13]RUS60564.1 helix-turn-helix transcriptional regulator [Pseudorhodobacter sp. E13]
MTTETEQRSRRLSLRRGVFLAAAGLQIGCGIVFLTDVFLEWEGLHLHGVLEFLAVIGLGVGASLTLREYRSLLHRNTKVERELGVASGAFHEVITHHFDRWGLTAAERDVALLSIKGLSNADIAALRATRDGTIKAQTAAIYRKAGVSSRAELVSVMVEELIAGLPTPQA